VNNLYIFAVEKKAQREREKMFNLKYNVKFIYCKSYSFFLCPGLPQYYIW
jgi:hypothetical protein